MDTTAHVASLSALWMGTGIVTRATRVPGTAHCRPGCLFREVGQVVKFGHVGQVGLVGQLGQVGRVGRAGRESLGRSTLGASRAVPHPTTNRARCCLTPESGAFDTVSTSKDRDAWAKGGTLLPYRSQTRIKGSRIRIFCVNGSTGPGCDPPGFEHVS